MRYLLFTLIIIAGFQGPMHAQSIQHIEPPFWWRGMKNESLQLMIHGDKISAFQPKIHGQGVKLHSLHMLTNPNYLFLDLWIDPIDTSRSFQIEWWKDGEKKSEITYALHSREIGSSQREGFDQSDLIYLITPDRFANGNPNNDRVATLKEKPDRLTEYGRHGGDIRGIIQNLDYFQKMGFTAIWLNPVLENDQEKWSYHGYSTTDYYRVDARFGTNEEYVELAEKAHALGLKLIMDMIVNHCGSEHWWMKDLPSDDWINYSSGPYQETNHRKAALFDPYGSEEDRRIMEEGWFVPTMPDLNQRNPFMARYLIQNSIWWIEYARLGGIRQDTYSYADRDFLTDWTCAIMEEYPGFNIVGEEWVMDRNIISYWQRGKRNHDGYISCLPSLMDFPGNAMLSQSLREEDRGHGQGLVKIYEHLAGDYIYPDPFNLVIFPDNHDMSRIFTQLNEDMDLFRMAIVYVLTMRGIPQIYYGTEVLMKNPGTESHGIIRSDFPGGWAGDAKNAFSGAGLSPQEKEAQDFVKKLALWRKNQEVIHHGKLVHYIPREGVYVYFRMMENKQVMVILNKNPEERQLKLDRFKNQLQDYTEAREVITGKKIQLFEELTLSSRSVMVLEMGQEDMSR